MPLTASPDAVAVTRVSSALVAVTELKALGVLTALSAVWKVASALLSVPTAEMFAVTAVVLSVMTFCSGAWVAATSSDTSVLTLITEPPAAPALALLLLPAIETGVVKAVLLAEVVIGFPGR